MAFLKFKKGNYEALSSAAKVEGQILICGDTGEMFVDISNEQRVKIGDFTVVANITALEALDATKVPTTRLYYVEEGNILARSNGTGWVQVNKQKTAEELKTMLGLGSMAYVSEVVESNLSAELVEKINASAEGNHAHSNKDVLDGITAEKVAAWDGAQAAAEAKAAELVAAHEEAVETALEGKVDKVEGKSLLADTEIARLAGMSDGANKVEASETNGNIKIDGVETVVYTHPEKHAISEVDGLQEALDNKLEADDIANKADKATTLEGYGITDAYTIEQTDKKISDAIQTATGGESAKAVKEELDAYKLANDAAVEAAAKAAEDAQTAADEAQTDVDALAGIVGDVKEGKTVVGLINEAMDEAKAKVASVTAGDASVVIGGTATEPTVAAQISKAAGNALSLADDGLMVTIPTAAEYSIVKDADSGDYAAVYHLTKDGANVGAAINIPKDMVVQSGAVVENPEGQPEGTYIQLVLQNVAEPLYINVGDLIEYVTSGSAADDMVIISVSEDHKVSAEIRDGSITLAKLDATVQAAINKAHEHENKDVLDGITSAKVSAWDAAEQNAKDYAKDLDDAMNERMLEVEAKKHEHTNKDILDTITAEMLDSLVWGTFGA